MTDVFQREESIVQKTRTNYSINERMKGWKHVDLERVNALAAVKRLELLSNYDWSRTMLVFIEHYLHNTKNTCTYTNSLQSSQEQWKTHIHCQDVDEWTHTNSRDRRERDKHDWIWVLDLVSAIIRSGSGRASETEPWSCVVLGIWEVWEAGLHSETHSHTAVVKEKALFGEAGKDARKSKSCQAVCLCLSRFWYKQVKIHILRKMKCFINEKSHISA